MHSTSLKAQATLESCKPCEQLLGLRLPDVTISKAETKGADTIKAQWGAIVITKPFCRIRGVISKEIGFEILLPIQWNGRFLMSGGGGFVGSIQNGLAIETNNGYATAGTDTGHSGDGLTAEWAYDNMERQLNFGRLAVHRTAVVSKAVIENFYCKAPMNSYFLGCSRGGGQAMVEAQFYPEDFDGIVAGAPAYTWPAMAAKQLAIVQKNYPNPQDLKPVLTADNLSLLQDLVLKECDNLDGAVDKIISDPRKCKFDPAHLPLCPDGKAGKGCFTKDQVTTIKTIYSPLIAGGKQIYPAQPFGGEGERGSWDAWLAGTNTFGRPAGLHFYFSTNIYKYFVFNDPNWDYSKYDFKNFEKETHYAASFLDATQTDYSGLKQRRGKMILYHGWNDPALSAISTIEHYDGVLKRDKDAASYIRLFLLPGVLHCGGGPGCDDVDWLRIIRDWVESGKAPDQVISSKLEDGKAVKTLTLYPYPK